MGRPCTDKMNKLRELLILDEEDSHLLESPGNIWPVPQDGGHWRFWLRDKNTYVHRYLLNAKKGDYVDHINGNPSDNRKVNLRITSNPENCWNTKAHKDSVFSKHKGVSFWRFKHHKRKKPWICQIMSNGKVRKAYFASEIEAAKQYNLWAKELHGEFALLNVIEE